MSKHPISGQILEAYKNGAYIAVVYGGSMGARASAVQSFLDNEEWRFEGGVVVLEGQSLTADLVRRGPVAIALIDALEADSGALVVITNLDTHQIGLIPALLSHSRYARNASRMLVTATSQPFVGLGPLVAGIRADDRPRRLARFGASRSRELWPRHSWEWGDWRPTSAEIDNLFPVVEPGVQRTEPIAALLDASGSVPDVGAPFAIAAIEIANSVSSALLDRCARDPSLLHDLHWREFEELVAELFERDGFEVHLTGRSRDRGVDLFAVRRAESGSLLYVVECKKWAAERQVGPNVVRELQGVVDRERATMGVLATTSVFSPGARTAQQDLEFRLDLRDFAAIARWLQASAREPAS